MELRELVLDEMERRATKAGVNLPIEQTPEWAHLERTIPGKTSWGALELVKDGRTVGFISLFDYLTHGYHYLRSVHGPVWLEEPTAELEQEFVSSLTSYVKAHDKKQVFCRLAVKADLQSCRPTLSTLPYNQTVVIDLSGDGDEEALLSRMKTRGRRDVRKALRETPATYADETAQAAESFDEYYDVMVETAARDGFTCAPQTNYENMISILGPEHCRVFAGRVDGQVVTWSIVTVNGTHAVRYYGASKTDVPKRNFVTDGLVFFEAKTLSAEGKLDLDLMGIGNDFAPSLKGLNVFKCKFSKDILDIAPDRDVPFKPLVYASLVKARQLLKRKSSEDKDEKKGKE